MIKSKKLLVKLLLIFVAVISMPIIVKAADIPTKDVTTMKPGDVIYFDTAGLSDWSTVKIYIWQSGGNPYKQWEDADEMTNIAGTTIYSYTVPSSMQANKYNMLIFTNGTGGQTKDLGFVEGKYAYIVKDWSTGVGEGYWYLYDKSSINDKIASIEKIAENEQYYTPTSYGNLNNLIQQAKNQINGEVRLKEVKDSNNNYAGFYTDIDNTLIEIENIVKNLVVNKEILQTKVTEEEQKIDTYKQTYMPNSLEKLEEKINEAKQVLQQNSISVDEIKEAIKNIEDSKKEFILKADKSELEKLLREVEGLDKSIYTEESVQNLEEIDKNSKEIYNNENATQQQVDEAIQNLQEAIDELEKKTVDNNEGQNPDINDGGNEGQNPDINDGGNEGQNPDINDGENEGQNPDINDGENKEQNPEIKDDENKISDKKEENKESEKDKTPNTGDNIVLYIAVLIIALIGIIITRKIKNKN